MRLQQTLAHSVSCSGVGLHSGQPVTMTLRPAPPNTGVVFVNRNGHAGASLTASVEHLVPTELCTAISGNGFQVKTIEHVLAALAGLNVDNVYVELDASEAPVMDGSSAPFVRLIQSAGIVTQNRRQAYLKITRQLEVVDGSRCVRIEPSATPRISYTIQYDHPLIKTQTYSYEHSAKAFEFEIAEARTFGFLQEVEALWARSPDAKDARAVRIDITARGRALWQRIEQDLIEEERNIIAGLDPDVRRAAIGVVRDLARLAAARVGRQAACCGPDSECG